MNSTPASSLNLPHFHKPLLHATWINFFFLLPEYVFYNTVNSCQLPQTRLRIAPLKNIQHLPMHI